MKKIFGKKFFSKEKNGKRLLGKKKEKKRAYNFLFGNNVWNIDSKNSCLRFSKGKKFSFNWKLKISGTKQTCGLMVLKNPCCKSIREKYQT